jgi:hypothetical protein
MPQAFWDALFVFLFHCPHAICVGIISAARIPDGGVANTSLNSFLLFPDSSAKRSSSQPKTVAQNVGFRRRMAEIVGFQPADSWFFAPRTPSSTLIFEP